MKTMIVMLSNLEILYFSMFKLQTHLDLHKQVVFYQLA